MKKILLSLLTAALLSFVSAPVTYADFGDYSGDYDFGGFDDYDYDYDYDDYDYDDYDDYDYDDDDDGYSSYYYYRYTEAPEGSFDGEGECYDAENNKITVGRLVSPTDTPESKTGSNAVSAVMCGGIIGTIVTLIKRKKRKKSRFNQNAAPIIPGAERTNASTLKPIDEYKDIDPNFSETELKEKISNLYVRMQNSWTDKNIEALRPYFTDTLYAQFDRQLDRYRRNKTTNYIEKIAVLDVTLSGYKQEKENDIIVAEVYARITDYETDDTTGKIVRGDRNSEKFMRYEWTLTRRSGVVTGDNSGTRVISCPKCGAAVDINKSAKCEYCGSIISADSVDWVINGIKAISQRTR